MLKIIISLSFITVFFFKNYSQGIVAIYNHSIAISPSYTVNNNTGISVTGQVVNTSTNSITGTIHVNIAIDTSSTSTPKYAWRSTMSYPVTNLLPNATIAFSVNDNASDNNGYKIAGNGTTVVAWPIIGALTDSLTCKDSATTTIYILPLTQGIESAEQLENELQNIPNPLTKDLQFVNISNWKIEVIDIQGQVFEIKNSELKISNFLEGAFWLRFTTQNNISHCKHIIIKPN